MASWFQANGYRHSNNRRHNVGENIAWSSNSRSPSAYVEMWYSEVNDCPYLPGCGGRFLSGTGHFTALVWKGVTEIGCAIVGTTAGCRYVGGSGCDIPNMQGQGCYDQNVGSRGETASGCSASSGSSASLTPCYEGSNLGLPCSDSCTTANADRPWCRMSDGDWGFCNCPNANQIIPCGGNLGNSEGTPCHFPFEHHGSTYQSCTEADNDRPWCRTASGSWGNCDCGYPYDEISTCGGNAQGQPCQFPFQYDGEPQFGCIESNHDQPWCKTASGTWGNCEC